MVNGKPVRYVEESDLPEINNNQVEPAVNLSTVTVPAGIAAQTSGTSTSMKIQTLSVETLHRHEKQNPSTAPNNRRPLTPEKERRDRERRVEVQQ